MRAADNPVRVTSSVTATAEAVQRRVTRCPRRAEGGLA